MDGGRCTRCSRCGRGSPAAGSTLPWTYLTLGRLVRKFFFLILLTKKPYFLNVFAGANLSTPSHVLAIPTRLPAFPLLHGSVLRQSDLGQAQERKLSVNCLMAGQARLMAQLVGALEGLRGALSSVPRRGGSGTARNILPEVAGASSVKGLLCFSQVLPKLCTLGR